MLFLHSRPDRDPDAPQPYWALLGFPVIELEDFEFCLQEGARSRLVALR